MKVKSLPIVEFLEGRKENFLIPVYQRNYDWPKERCETLWADLEAVINNPHPHFFGSIVRVRNGDDNVVIDGQQRLTTVSLLMLAIAHRTEFLGLDKPDLKEVMDLYQNGRRQPKIKLKLLREDMQAYECIVSNRKDCSEYSKSKIVQNYNFFSKKLDASNVNTMFEATKQLIVIDALLEENDDNPQAVFESLNDKAEKLNDADKIRNFILMNFDYDKQQQLYNDYWSQMEKNVGISSSDTTRYIWRYIQYKTNKKIVDKDIYSEFKSYVQNRDKENVLCDLYKISQTYKIILQTKVVGDADEIINDRLNLLLNELKMHTVIPLLLDIIEEYKSDKIPGNDVVQILDVLISYIVRRGLIGSPAMFNSFFLMNEDIHKLLDKFTDGSYLDIVKYKIYSATNKNEIPNDNSVLENVINLGIYNKNTTICRYVLVNLEKYFMRQKDPNRQHVLNANMLSIEHIMPQTLSGANGVQWQHELGDDWENIHRKYLHTLGNLTLTAYNSNLSNSTFARKKQELQNYAPLYLNEYLYKTNSWNKDTIYERGKELAKLVLELWPIYKPEYEYHVQQTYDKFDLDNTSFATIVTKRKPKSVELNFMGDVSLNVSNWRDAYISIINELYNCCDYRQKMLEAFDWADKTNYFTEIISKSPQVYGSSGTKLWECIIPGNPIYFKTTKNAADTCIAIKKWLEYLHIDPGELTIVLK